MYSELDSITSWILFHIVHFHRTFPSITPWKKIASISNEYQLQLAFQTFEKDPQLNVRKATQLYNILHSTLSTQINNISTYTTTITNSRKLTALKEEIIVREVLDLDSRRFPPQMHDIEDITNRLLAIYDAIHIGPHWTFNFVKRQSKLRTYWNRPYDYQKAQYEDPEIIEVWFQLFQNVVAKYNIIKSDIWNFDETGFLISQIISTFVVILYDRYRKVKIIQSGNWK